MLDDVVVSETQRAFVPGRLITNNAIVGFECMHKLKSMYSGKLGFLALKFDMNKAYDRVEWWFVREIMIKLGFSTDWVRKIWNCICSVSFSILINGDPCIDVILGRGLRQGCSLSPYLFILCSEGLSALLRDATMRGSIHGIKAARGSPAILHLFFADDSLLFFKATRQEAEEIKRLLSVYEIASGQVINFQKLAICFGPNMNVGLVASIKSIFDISVMACHSKYLGLLTSISQNRWDIFTLLVNRVSQQVAGWKENMFSFAGKEVLIKAVAQAILTYTMSLLCLPDGIVEDIHRLFSKFWSWERQDALV